MSNLRPMADEVTQAWRENAGDWLAWARTPGLDVEELREPRPEADWPARHPEIADAYTTPFFLHILARLR